MTSMRIAEVAARTGIPATTLRYYEQIGLVVPQRRANSYRAYDERDLELLTFISRARQLDLGLEQLRDLVDVRDAQDCATVAHSLAEAVSTRLSATRARITDLVTLAAELQAAGQRLAATASGGPCSADCPCVADPAPGGDGLPPATDIACTLDSGDVARRLVDWQQALGGAEQREQIPGGLRFRFPPDLRQVEVLARLVGAEHACCPFFTFTLVVDAAAVTFEVVAPAQAGDVVATVFGPPGTLTGAGHSGPPGSR